MWKKRGNAANLTDFMTAASGCSVEDLMHPKAYDPESVVGLSEAADMIQEAVNNHNQICVVGDYDADGVTSSAILYLLLKELGVVPRIRLPKRMSEGYGLSEKIIDDISGQGFSGLLITVDNGIAAVESIQQAASYNWPVVVLDHHLPGTEIPPADVIVDQHLPDRIGHGYRYYCGAGLAFKLAQMMLGNKNPKLLRQLEALAAIGTVADVMPLHDDNRVIVKEGLEAIHDGDITAGLMSLITQKNLSREDITSTTIGFQIAPIINAAGRLLDDGARLPCAMLASQKPVPKHADQLIALNEERKRMVEEVMANTKPVDFDKYGAPQFYISGNHDPKMEGVLGIIAGKMAEAYGVPTFAMAPSVVDLKHLDKNGNPTVLEWKGSARSYGDVNLKERMDLFGDTMVRYGGHAGAAGFAVATSKLPEFVDRARKAFADYDVHQIGSKFYDLEVTSHEAGEVERQMHQFEPFGEGCPEPIFRMNHIPLYAGKQELFSYMKDGLHVRIRAKEVDVIWFREGERFRNEFLNQGVHFVDVIGRLSVAHSERYGDTLQLVAQDAQASEF